jgi:AcrR family transcriptional regulator
VGVAPQCITRPETRCRSSSRPPRAFRERGYHNTSLDDLAGSLKVTKPTLYLYMPNKEAILFECFRAGLAQIQATLEECERAGRTGRASACSPSSVGYAAAIVGDFGWCMLRAEGPAPGRRDEPAHQTTQGRHRQAHAARSSRPGSPTGPSAPATPA